MKLWQKIFLSTLALMALTTNGLSLLFLQNSRVELWQRERQRATTQQQYLASLVKTGVMSQRLQRGRFSLPENEVTAAAVTVLERQEPDDYLLVCQLLLQSTPLTRDATGFAVASNLSGLNCNDPAFTYDRTFHADGRFLFALNSPLTLEQTQYRLLCVFDVTDLEQHQRSQTAAALLLSLFASLFAAVALLFLVKALLRPLGTLSRASRRIAAGNYSERVQLPGKDELTRLAQDMNRMADAVESRVGQLQQVADDQKAFIANMAHEMKTPLTSILGFADLLYIQKTVPDRQRIQYAGIIVEETRRMRSLSGKLMELLNVGSKNLVFTTEQLQSVIAEAAAAMQPVLQSAGMRLECSCEPELYLSMDRELFKSLLYNFIDNGRKASPEGSVIKLMAHADGGAAEILIRDYGQGIPQKELEKIRQPFYMVDKSRSRKAGGAGLGLALCEEIARIHSGVFSIDSRVGQGTLITLRFPLAVPPREDSEQEAAL